MTYLRVIYSMYGAPNEHPQVVMRKLATKLDFTILGATPQSIADVWWFWIAFDKEPPNLPNYIQPAEWLPVGTA